MGGDVATISKEKSEPEESPIEKEVHGIDRTPNDWWTPAVEQQKETDMSNPELEASRESYPIDGLNEVKNLIGELGGRVGELGARISPILNPIAPTPDKGGALDPGTPEPPTRSLLMDVIESLNEDARMVISAVEYLLNRLDL